MSCNAQAAALLAAHQHSPFHHQIGDVVKADGGFDDLEAVCLGDAVYHARGRDGADDFALPAPLFNQIAQDEGKDAVGVYKTAERIHRPNSVSIPIGGQSHIPMPPLNGGHELPQMLFNGFGMDAVEAGVHFVPNVVHMATAA